MTGKYIPHILQTIKSNVLSINYKGVWETGLLCSQDVQGRGFSQSMGYFEARMKLPVGPGVWPAFWLISEKHPTINSEIDIMEYYGAHPKQYEIVVHHWNKEKLNDKNSKNRQTFVHKSVYLSTNALAEDFHSYGVEIGEINTVFYLDRREVARLPTTDDMKYPMYILVNLAYGSGWPIDKMVDPSVLQVDYIKAFIRKHR